MNIRRHLIRHSLLAAILAITVAADAAYVWTPLGNTGAPSERLGFSTVWTGTEMIVWGGRIGSTTTVFNSGGRYNPATNTWTSVSTVGAPSQRSGQTAIWTGQRMIIWGGSSDVSNLNDGGSYDPLTDTWSPLAALNAPTPRGDHRAVWTGDKMIVWGGYNNGWLNSGAVYTPSSDTWAPTTFANAPGARAAFAAVWTGTEMIVYGGGGASSGTAYYDTGGRYNPASNTWTTITTANAPQGRRVWDQLTAVWTGTEMLVWGGSTTGFPFVNSGGRYNPATNTWTSTSTTNAPAARDFHATAWTGTELIVWSGAPNNGTNLGGTPINTGGRYNPATDTWLALPAINTPIARRFSTAIWTGNSAIVWGGADNSQHYGDTFALGADGDNDGLADIYETGTGIYVSPLNTGTSPANPDTDGDGLADGVEINQHGSNPNLADTDGDGFADGFEVSTGFNPTSAASTPEAFSTLLTAVEFRFNAANGQNYRIESSTDLSNWSILENNIPGTGSTIVRFYSIEGQSRKFYRARRN